MDKMWYYAAGKSDKQGPISEEELRRLISEGKLKASDLAWTDGMADWTTLQSLPDLIGTTPSPAIPASVTTSPSPSLLPPKLMGWMGFVGVMTIIMGVFQCISCIGIIYGVFMIIAGASLLGARTALSSVSRIDPNLTAFFEKLSSFMSMMGIYYIVMFVCIILVLLGYFIFFAAIAAGLSGHSW